MYFTTVMSSLMLVLPFALAQPTNLEPRYAKGWCGLHVTQWQKHESGVRNAYQITLLLKDANQKTFGGVNLLPIPNRETGSVNSQMPHPFHITVGSVDGDPIKSHYAGQAWSTNSGQCSMGAYDNGKREGDCGFTC